MAKKKPIKKPTKTVAKKAQQGVGRKPVSTKGSKKTKSVIKPANKKSVSLKGKSKKGSAKPKPPRKLTAAQIINEKRKRGVNRYNIIRAAISDSYAEQGKKISNATIKEIYAWIKEKHADSPTSQIVDNIDALIDSYFESLGLETIDLSKYNPAVEWFGFKEVLHDELSLHKDNDLIRVDLTDIGVIEWVDFLMEDYLTGGEKTYEKCKESGIRRVSPVPMIELIEAFYDAGLSSNVFMYKITAEEEFRDTVGEGVVPPVELVSTPEGVEKPTVTAKPEPTPAKPSKPTAVVAPTAGAPTTEQIQSAERIRIEEIKSAERIKMRELELTAKSERQDKERKELLLLFRDKLITLKEYTDAVRDLGIS